jgi:hypothetical protein
LGADRQRGSWSASIDSFVRTSSRGGSSRTNWTSKINSIDPVFAGRRVEVRASQKLVTAIVLDTGELTAQHSWIFAGFQTIVAPAHQSQLELQHHDFDAVDFSQVRFDTPGR